MHRYNIFQEIKIVYALLFFSYYRFPDHEIQIKKIALEMGFEHISLSSEVMPMLRIVPRGHTGIFLFF